MLFVDVKKVSVVCLVMAVMILFCIRRNEANRNNWRQMIILKKNNIFGNSLTINTLCIHFVTAAWFGCVRSSEWAREKLRIGVQEAVFSVIKSSVLYEDLDKSGMRKRQNNYLWGNESCIFPLFFVRYKAFFGAQESITQDGKCCPLIPFYHAACMFLFAPSHIMQIWLNDRECACVILFFELIISKLFVFYAFYM